VTKIKQQQTNLLFLNGTKKSLKRRYIIFVKNNNYVDIIIKTNWLYNELAWL